MDSQVQAQVSNNERLINEREKEINEIVKSIHTLASIFKDLQTMVIDQGTVLDRIDYNIEQTAVHVEAAHGELVKVKGIIVDWLGAQVSG
jgi:syntaxin 16